MTTATAAQVLAAWRNERRPSRTHAARVMDALEHANTSPLRQMLELERQRRAQTREGSQ